MANKYLKRKIRNYEIYKTMLISILMCLSFFTGEYVYSKKFFGDIIVNIIVGLVLGIIGAILTIIFENYMISQARYRKGLELESQVEDKLKRLRIKYEPHLEDGHGDLDFLLSGNNNFYGIEVKNQSGLIRFENNNLMISNFKNTYILKNLLKHCKLIRDIKFGDSSDRFIKPILIFGYKAVVDIPQNKIKFNNVEIIVATINDFERYII
ncbi:MAG: nuclease-related domain-containing protein [Patescibacteria group bacterium]|nr:nuclease-related domain-containing protein [Patescibacteria group bacterium]MDD5121567.1 nuclease-related domain-containing protein [Patescibacteria group bacterium]MDD5222241.1 nuclease-related domain-containing protein [Patescibacteria group bacterium]MDD5396269.1 nuclease-related domain-containing protein [Patescibacteria group bacterium]